MTTSGTGLSVKDFGDAFKRFLEQSVDAAPAEPPFFLAKLLEHFKTDPARLPVIAQDIEGYDRPNLALALEAYLRRPGRSAELIGITDPLQKIQGIGIADL